MSDQPLNAERFNQLLSYKFHDVLDGVSSLAVAVSGGPDSMALAVLLARYAQSYGVDVHVLSVDHGLRDGSGEEARSVGAVLSGFSNIQHHILTWDAPSQKRVQEEARKARYALMAEHCAAHDIGVLFLGHHRDDQAETVLFRLAKGSGLDGLCGMREIYNYNEQLKICRPLLEVSKEDLVRVCDDADISYVDDPSNQSTDFARVRLRRGRAILEEEGLTSKRLSVSAKRLSRARDALEEMTDKAYGCAAKKINTKQIVFELRALFEWPEEIVLRAVSKAMNEIAPHSDYAPRMEKVEALVLDLIHQDNFRKRTLGGVIFTRDDKNGLITLGQE